MSIYVKSELIKTECALGIEVSWYEVKTDCSESEKDEILADARKELEEYQVGIDCTSAETEVLDEAIVDGEYLFKIKLTAKYDHDFDE